MNTKAARQLKDTPVDVKLELSALWIAMLFVFAYVDIFGFYRADVLEAALNGTVGTTGWAVNQVFLTSTLIFIAIPSLMVAGSLLLTPRVNRVVHLVVAPLYVISIIASCLGEEWAYYLIGSAMEVVLLLAIVRTAWTWPAPVEVTSSTPARHVRPAAPVGTQG
ncbi:MAG: DUF6326 family protein [Ornithinimicrobium sp.]|uniref:DUF6326 family protein n=1 Tax=Ornithinimicrobium sp. TaxID=1977084 RepID=UPI0026DEC6ED|nr:DUF6326 family protein [Ornithinimicrobium sp.]MDO5739886.1 DUF6326 family protein [Ornithinimicrobium sp.]